MSFESVPGSAGELSGPAGRELVIGPSSSLSDALTHAGNQASASTPWSVRLLPGTYSVSPTITCPSNVTLTGSGKLSTIINRSDTSSSTLFDARSTADFKVQNLQIVDAGSGSSAVALNYADATGVSVSNVRIEMTAGGLAFSKQDTSAHATDTDYDVHVDNCEFIGDGFDLFIIFDSNAYIRSSLFQSSPTVTGSDCIRLRSGTMRLIGCDITTISTQTYTGTPGSSINVGGGTSDFKLYLTGCRIFSDLSGGNINGATVQFGVVNVSSTTTDDWDVFIEGSQISFITGTVTSAGAVSGLLINTTGQNATKGRVSIVGSAIRDLGGSGGTIRRGVVINATSIPSTKVLQSLKQNGSKFDWAYRITGSPTLTQANYGVTEQTNNYQTGTATFNSAATAAGTLSPTFSSSNTTDYNILVDGSIGETFFTTAKTNTGFTLNSSNATSTATVRWVMLR